MKSFYRTIILLLGLTALPLFTGSAQAREKEEFSRGIEMSTFVPKGNWIAGGSFSYSENTASENVMKKIGMTKVSCHGGRKNKISDEERNEYLYEMWM